MCRKRFIQLCVRSTTHSPCTEARFAFDGLGFFAPCVDVAREAELGQGIAYLLVIITLVQAHALRLVRRWLRPLHDDTFQGGTHQFHVRAVGAGHDQTDGHTMAFGQQAPLDPVFTASVGLGPVFSPPNGAFVMTPSILENDQSMPCSSSNCSTPACQSWKNTSACTHA